MKKLPLTFLLFCLIFPVAVLGQPHEIISNITLSPQEKAFLDEHPLIRVANDMDWSPFDYNEFGTAKGFGVDYIKLLAAKLDIEIIFVNGRSWNGLLTLFQQKKIDVMPVFYKNATRKAYTNFTTAYHKGQLGIFTNSQSTVVSNISELADIRVSIKKAHGSIPIIEQAIPGITLTKYEHIIDLVKNLSTGKLDAIIGEPLVISHYAKENHAANIQFSDYIPLSRAAQAETSFHIGVRKDWPLLQQIL